MYTCRDWLRACPEDNVRPTPPQGGDTFNDVSNTPRKMAYRLPYTVFRVLEDSLTCPGL